MDVYTLPSYSRKIVFPSWLDTVTSKHFALDPFWIFWASSLRKKKLHVLGDAHVLFEGGNLCHKTMSNWDALGLSENQVPLNW